METTVPLVEMPSTVVLPWMNECLDCELKVISQPPESVRLLEIVTGEYVPAATAIISSATALLMAACMVAQGKAEVEQEFKSLPVVATYQVTLPAAVTSFISVSRVGTSSVGRTATVAVRVSVGMDVSAGVGVSVRTGFSEGMDVSVGNAVSGGKGVGVGSIS